VVAGEKSSAEEGRRPQGLHLAPQKLGSGFVYTAVGLFAADFALIEHDLMIRGET
jgi:hypothetical protein